MGDAEKQEIIWREVMGEMAIHEFDEWLFPKVGLGNQYTDSRINSPVYCPSCFEPVQTSFTQCPNCGFVLDISMMQVLRDNAFEFAAYAWNYRKLYEKDIVKGKIYQGEATTKYYLTPPEGWLVYLASIAFAAIIGGLSYDTFKKLLLKLSKGFRKRFQKEIPRGRWQRQFYNNLREYWVGKRDPDSPICRAYLKGLIRGSRLRASFERAPNLYTDLVETMRSVQSTVENETVESEIAAPFNIEPPSEADIKQHLQEVIEQHAKMSLAVEQLKKYLSELDEKNV